MKQVLPDLSRFEVQCLRRIQTRGEASARDIQADLPAEAGYSTVRKIIERLEQKGAVERVRLEGKAWIYRATVPASALIKREIRLFLDTLFGGSAAPLIAHLADMDALDLEDLEALKKHIDGSDQAHSISGNHACTDGGNEDRTEVESVERTGLENGDCADGATEELTRSSKGA